MLGNVSEWCRDWYLKDLPGGTDPEATEPRNQRVVRGGICIARVVRAGFRDHNPPQARNIGVGFRLAITSD